MSLSDHVRIAAELRERLALDQEDEETRHDVIEGERQTPATGPIRKWAAWRQEQ